MSEDTMVRPFSWGRTTDTESIQCDKKLILPDGGLLTPGQYATVSPEYAQVLYAQGFAHPATPSLKAMEAAPKDKMQHSAVAKKGQA